MVTETGNSGTGSNRRKFTIGRKIGKDNRKLTCAKEKFRNDIGLEL